PVTGEAGDHHSYSPIALRFSVVSRTDAYSLQPGSNAYSLPRTAAAGTTAGPSAYHGRPARRTPFPGAHGTSAGAGGCRIPLRQSAAVRPCGRLRQVSAQF